jgi:hypothetical protein
MPDAEVVPDLQPFGEEPNDASNRRRSYILSNNATGAPAHEAGALIYLRAKCVFGPDGPRIKAKTDQKIIVNTLHGRGCT